MSDPSLEHSHDFHRNRERDEVLSRGPSDIGRIVSGVGRTVIDRNEQVLVNGVNEAARSHGLASETGDDPSAEPGFLA